MGERAAARDVVVATVVPAHPAPLVAAGARREVGLHADDRLDPGRAGLGVEVVGAEHVAVVGHRQRRHAELGVAGEQLGQPGGAVEHGVLGVDVQVHERRVARHGAGGLRRCGRTAARDRPARTQAVPVAGEGSVVLAAEPTRDQPAPRHRHSGRRRRLRRCPPVAPVGSPLVVAAPSVRSTGTRPCRSYSAIAGALTSKTHRSKPAGRSALARSSSAVPMPSPQASGRTYSWSRKAVSSTSRPTTEPARSATQISLCPTTSSPNQRGASLTRVHRRRHRPLLDAPHAGGQVDVDRGTGLAVGHRPEQQVGHGSCTTRSACARSSG